MLYSASVNWMRMSVRVYVLSLVGIDGFITICMHGVSLYVLNPIAIHCSALSSPFTIPISFSYYAHVYTLWRLRSPGGDMVTSPTCALRKSHTCFTKAHLVSYCRIIHLPLEFIFRQTMLPVHILGFDSVNLIMTSAEIIVIIICILSAATTLLPNNAFTP